MVCVKNVSRRSAGLNFHQIPGGRKSPLPLPPSSSPHQLISPFRRLEASKDKPDGKGKRIRMDSGGGGKIDFEDKRRIEG